MLKKSFGMLQEPWRCIFIKFAIISTIHPILTIKASKTSQGLKGMRTGHSIISTPSPMDEVPKNLTPKKKKIKVLTQNTPQKKAKFLLPIRKKGHSVLFPLEKMARSKDSDCLTPSKWWPPSKGFIHRGMWILNGMAQQYCCASKFPLLIYLEDDIWSITCVPKMRV